MATYIPGVEDKIPQSQPFVPDYKFLSDVLHTRQDRFDKNYKQLNDVYGKVVHANLTRNDNKYVRDQYAEQLAPQIKQISGLDLSLQENVDAAYGLFKPFYEDEQVIKDLTATATLQQQRKKMTSFKDSSIRAVREKYWDYGRQGLDIWQEDFKNADPQKALGMGLPQYIEDVDLVEQAMMLLDNSELGETTGDMYISQDNKWLITQKSGSLITAAPTGRMIEVKDSKGKVIMVPETENLALNHVKDRLMDDPKVQAAYHLRNFVDMRNYVKEKSEELGGDDAAKEAWAAETMETYKPFLEEEISNLSKVKENKKLEVSSWEAYADKIGIEPGSEDDISFLNSMDELELVNKVITSQTQRLQDATAPTDDIKNLLNKAYSLAMGHQMGADMLTSASAYAKKTMTRDMEPNPNYTAWVEHQYAMARINYKESLRKTKEKKEKVLSNVSTPVYRYKGGDVSTTGRNTGAADAQGIIDGEDITSDAISYSSETVLDNVDYSINEQKRIIKEVYLANAQDLNLDGSKFTPIFSPDLMVGNGRLEMGEVYYDDKTGLAEGKVGEGVLGGIKAISETVKEGDMTVPERVIHYPKETSMTWEEFNNIDDADQINDMYMNMINLIDHADTKFPSYMTLDTKTKSDISYGIYNLRGNMSMFNEGVDKMAANYMQVQQHLVGTDEDFKYAAQDGGSIFNNDGILIDREDWIERYVSKWAGQTNTEIRMQVGTVNDPLVTGDYSNLNMGQYGTSPDSTASQPSTTPQDPNDLQMIIGNEWEGDLNFANLKIGGGKYWDGVNPMGGSMQDEWGNQLFSTPTANTSAMYTDAEMYYDYMYGEINKKMTKDGQNSAEFGFNLSAYLSGQPETIGGDFFQSGEHQFKYDENALAEVNAPAIDFANQVLQILDGDPASFSVYAGGNIILEKGETLGAQNAEMMNVIQQWYYSMGDNYGNNKAEGGGAPKANGLDFSISYAKNRGGADTDYAGYEIHLGTDWAGSSVLGRYDKSTDEYITGIVTKENSPEFITDNIITILFDKNLDDNKYKTGDKETQWVLNELKNNDGRIVRNVPGAGTITIFNTGDGNYMYSEQLIQYEGNKKIPFAGQQMIIPASQIANILATQQQRLTEMGTANMEQIKSYNIANKINK